MPLTTPAAVREARRALSAESFPGTIRSYYPYWDAQYRPFLIEAVNAFPADRLDYKPSPDLLTAREMIVHIAEAEVAWVRGVIEGDPIEEWVVPADDPAQGWKLVIDAPDQASLLARLETCHRPTQAWLDRPVGELSRVVTRQIEGEADLRRYTVHWILDHLQEHEIHHRGLLNLYLRLVGVDPPSI
jgi:uncharacterized damage-inducible protein DinB